MKSQASQLWPIGTYWHLQTRPDEWKVMSEGEMKSYAKEMDKV